MSSIRHLVRKPDGTSLVSYTVIAPGTDAVSTRLIGADPALSDVEVLCAETHPELEGLIADVEAAGCYIAALHPPGAEHHLAHVAKSMLDAIVALNVVVLDVFLVDRDLAEHAVTRLERVQSSLMQVHLTVQARAIGIRRGDIRAAASRLKCARAILGYLLDAEDGLRCPNRLVRRATS